jgi:radical SAM superfamily enzyme YgiQ (UPF0313 family)
VLALARGLVRRDLLDGMTGLGRWWLTQASMDIVKDPDLLGRMERSGCAGVFLGIESLDDEDLKAVDKRQNRASAYRDAIRALHDRGICVMAGFISGFDDQTEDAVRRTADRLQALGVDVPFLSVLTPFRGTPLYDDLLRDERVLKDRDWNHYNGYNVAFRPAKMTPDALLGAHRALWDRAFSAPLVLARVARAARHLSPGGALLSATMNGFYGLKALTGNTPARAVEGVPGAIAHPDPHGPPTRLLQPSRRRPVASAHPR